MNLSEYQLRAAETDQRPRVNGIGSRSDDAIVIPLLGIGGELGTLQSEYKKYLRDGEAHRLFKEHVKEELGDILWYLANLADKFDLRLDEIAEANLEKIGARWLPSPTDVLRADELFDAAADASEQLPRSFEVEFRATHTKERPEELVQVYWNNQAWGDPLGDNAYDDDGYRFHDALHLAHAAVLGWSPVCRRDKHFGGKRRSNPTTDAVEDGGRAGVIEEAIVAYVYGHARNHGWFAEVDSVDYAVLKTIGDLVAGLEVQMRPARDWERSILDGYRVWRQLRDQNGGVVVGDLLAGTIEYRPLDQVGVKKAEDGDRRADQSND